MEPKHDPVEVHAEMTQIPTMKPTGDLKGVSTSALQGHGVDEGPALDLAKQMSLADLEERTRGMQAKATAEYDEAMRIAAEPDLATKRDFLDYAGKKTRPLEDWKIEEQKRRSVEKFAKIRGKTTESARRQDVLATFRQGISAPSTPKRSKRTMRTITPTKPIATLSFTKSAAEEISELQQLLKLSAKKTPFTPREQMKFTVLKGDYPSLKGFGRSETTMKIQDALADAKAKLQPERIFSRPATPTAEEETSVELTPTYSPTVSVTEEKAVELAPAPVPKAQPIAQPIAQPAIVHGPARRPVSGRRRRYLPMARTHPVPTISPTVQWEEDYRRKIGWGSRIWGVMDLLTGEEKQAKRRRKRIILPVSDF